MIEIKISIPPVATVRGWFNCAKMFFKKIARFLNSPEIGVKPPTFVGDTLQLEVQNVRGGRAFPKVFLEDVTDAACKKTGVVTSPIEVYRLESLEPICLAGGARAVFGILSEVVVDGIGSCLRVNTVLINNGIKSRGQMFLSEPCPLAQQKELRLTYRVVFYSTNDYWTALEPDESLLYSVTPLPESGKYVLQSVKSPVARKTRR